MMSFIRIREQKVVTKFGAVLTERSGQVCYFSVPVPTTSSYEASRVSGKAFQKFQRLLKFSLLAAESSRNSHNCSSFLTVRLLGCITFRTGDGSRQGPPERSCSDFRHTFVGELQQSELRVVHQDSREALLRDGILECVLLFLTCHNVYQAFFGSATGFDYTTMRHGWLSGTENQRL